MHNYTDTLNETIRDSVRRIESGAVDVFRSNIFSWGESSDIVWREAAQDPVSKTWTVTHCEAGVSASGQGPRNIKTYCTYGMCFFDALHRVAHLDAEPELLGLGNRLDQVPAFIIPPHHRAQAEEIGIPYDDKGFPVPAVNGRIMVSGSYDEDAFSIAARSVNNVSAPKSDQPILSGALPLRAGISAPSLQTSLSPFVMARLKKRLSHYNNVVSSQDSAMNRALLIGFANKSGKNALKGIGGTVVSAGVGYVSASTLLSISSPLIGFAAVFGSFASFIGLALGGAAAVHFWRENAQFPKVRFNNMQKELQKMAHEFPEGSEMRHDILRFHDEIQIGYQVLRAKACFNAVAAGAPGASFRLSRSLKKLERLCKEFGISSERKQAFVESINKDNADDLRRRISSHIQQRAHKIESRLNIETLHGARLQTPAPS